MSDAIRRAIRTFFQTFVGVLITSGIFSATAEAGVVDWSALKKVAISAAAAAAVAVVTYIQNSLEDAGVVPAPLKEPVT